MPCNFWIHFTYRIGRALRAERREYIFAQEVRLPLQTSHLLDRRYKAIQADG